jgi:two-component system sensor histidine kinase HydH
MREGTTPGDGMSARIWFPYNPAVDAELLAEMKRYIGFGPADEANVGLLAGHVRPHLARVVERFYEELLKNPNAQAVFTGGEGQMARQRERLLNWLEEIFGGPYDDAYLRKRLQIGSTHVRVGLPQQFMLLGMELIWQELFAVIREADVPGAVEKLASLHKLLTLDLAVMLDSYKETYSEQVRSLERSAVEERLTRAEHLAEIGQLAASLAHEIKNPLAGISGAIQVIRGDLGPNDRHQPIITEILAQIHRLDAAVKDLLLYARPAIPRTAEFPLTEVVRGVVTILGEEPVLQKRRIEFDLVRTDSVVRADRGQMEQVLINLLLNAAHASRDGDLIRVEVRPAGEWVSLIIVDRGEGMNEEVLQRAFEPFFTTKARGTGLGLPICRKIVEANSGVIWLESRPGLGTTAHVQLPRHGV